MRSFWAQGYEAASVDALCQEMNMPRATLYKSFGDKEGLFLATIAHYGSSRIATVTDRLGAGGSLRSDLAGFFAGVIALGTADPRTPGCLVSCVLADAAGANPRLRNELVLRFEAMERVLARRLDRARIDEGFDAAPGLAGLIAAIARGLMVRARAGTGVETLRPVADAALLCVCGPAT